MGYQFIGDHPQNRENGRSIDIQGVTHDDDNWFFTQTSTLWKFPVSHDLHTYISSGQPPFTLKVGIPPALGSLGYNHFGDLDYYRGYLFVPMEGRDPKIVAVLRASDLSYVGMFELMHYASMSEFNLVAQKSAPWCAVEPKTGMLWTSEGTITDRRLIGYRIDHDALAQGHVIARHNSWKTLSLPETIPQIQGGAFSEDGALFYLINGYYEDCNERECGIRVFHWTKGALVAKSTNGFGSFNYEFHTGLVSDAQEPEGITVWNLDGGRAPGIRGQVHALLLENDKTSDNDLFFKHYQVIWSSLDFGRLELQKITCVEPATPFGDDIEIFVNGIQQGGQFPIEKGQSKDLKAFSLDILCPTEIRFTEDGDDAGVLQIDERYLDKGVVRQEVKIKDGGRYMVEFRLTALPKPGIGAIGLEGPLLLLI